MKHRALVVGAALSIAGPAAAQECHPSLPTDKAPDTSTAEPPPISVRTGLALEAAAIDDGLGRRGSYTGAIPSLELAAFGFRARAAIGAYHIAWGQEGSGLGDLDVALQRGLVTLGDDVQLGAALSATLPTGDVRDELGMGHAMIMPALWGRWAGARDSLLVSIVYGSMLGGHHHGMLEPVVSPMNSEEASAAVRAGHRFGALEVALAASGAIPIGAGEARAAVGGGARWRFGATELGLDVSAPFGGTPIYGRGVVEVAHAF